MAGRKKNAQSKRGAPSGKARVGAFDKGTAVRVVEVPIASLGVWTLPDEASKAERIWLEWSPSAALEPTKRRAFVSKFGVAGAQSILTGSGVQVPRRGWSGSLQNRVLLTLGPGRVKVWAAPERRTGTVAPDKVELATKLLEGLTMTPTTVVKTTHSSSTPSSRR